MPVYEYYCQDCQSEFDLYQSKFSEKLPACPNCGAESTIRLLSRFSVKKSSMAVYDDILSDSRLVKGIMNNDPKSLAEWNKKMSQGEKVAPEYEEIVEKMERGKMPSKSEQNKNTDSA